VHRIVEIRENGAFVSPAANNNAAKVGTPKDAGIFRPPVHVCRHALTVATRVNYENTDGRLPLYFLLVKGCNPILKQAALRTPIYFKPMEDDWTVTYLATNQIFGLSIERD